MEVGVLQALPRVAVHGGGLVRIEYCGVRHQRPLVFVAGPLTELVVSFELHSLIRFWLYDDFGVWDSLGDLFIVAV